MRYYKRLTFEEKIENYITPALVNTYLDLIEVNGKVLTTPKIYDLLNKSGALGDKLAQVEIAKTDDLVKMEEDVISKTLEELL